MSVFVPLADSFPTKKPTNRVNHKPIWHTLALVYGQRGQVTGYQHRVDYYWFLAHVLCQFLAREYRFLATISCWYIYKFATKLSMTTASWRLWLSPVFTKLFAFDRIIVRSFRFCFQESALILNVKLGKAFPNDYTVFMMMTMTIDMQKATRWIRRCHDEISYFVLSNLIKTNLICILQFYKYNRSTCIYGIQNLLV